MDQNTTHLSLKPTHSCFYFGTILAGAQSRFIPLIYQCRQENRYNELAKLRFSRMSQQPFVSVCFNFGNMKLRIECCQEALKKHQLQLLGIGAADQVFLVTAGPMSVLHP